MNYFFDIPVYRLSSDKYYKQLELFKEESLYGTNEESKKIKTEFYIRNPENKIWFEEDIFKKFGGAWQYNEIIGFIKLYSVGSQIRGEYFRVNSKIIKKTRRKTFEWVSDKLVPEITIFPEDSNEVIFTIVYNYLMDCKKELKNRYLDLDNFEKLGHYIDWKQFLSKSSFGH